MVETAGVVLALALMGSFVTEVAQVQTSADSRRLTPGFDDRRGSGVTVSAQESESPTTVALKFFAALPKGDIAAKLRALRQTQISPAERARALAMLPKQGELAPNGGERRKLASLEAVLKYHDRSTMEIKVVDLPYAGLAIHQRAFLLVSRLALRLLSAGELQAAVAHEIGHEYFWAEYEETGNPPAAASRHTIELKCDGIAALTLLALGLDVSRLRSAMTKMIDFNRSIGVKTDETGYPTVRERDIFVRTLLKMEWATFKKPRDRQLALVGE
jgi:hypothetical protein